MTGREFERHAEEIWGADWHAQARAAFDVDQSTLWRWVHGRTPVSGPAGKLMEHLLAQHRRREKLRAYDRSYKRNRRQGGQDA
jgi:hypothetical protein